MPERGRYAPRRGARGVEAQKWIVAASSSLLSCQECRRRRLAVAREFRKFKSSRQPSFDRMTIAHQLPRTSLELSRLTCSISTSSGSAGRSCFSGHIAKSSLFSSKVCQCNSLNQAKPPEKKSNSRSSRIGRLSYSVVHAYSKRITNHPFIHNRSRWRSVRLGKEVTTNLC